MNKKHKFFFFIFLLNVFVFSIIPSTIIIVSAWGDNSDDPNMRPSYTKAEIDADKLGDKITFNSISDNEEFGDEKNFVIARMYNDNDTSHPWHKNEITVEDGEEYVILMYIHNNNPKGFDAIAKDVRA